MGKLIFKIVSVALKAISPAIRTQLGAMIAALKKSAEATDNVWDDLFVEILEAVLGLDEP